MKIVSSLHDIVQLSTKWKKRGERISLVPTMGCLHEGHLSLMCKAKSIGDKVIVSIFVNPMQFGPGEDLDSYPRQLVIDCDLAEQEGVDLIFCPEIQEMYNPSFQTSISVEDISQGMCGKDRPGHFNGVATVVIKLFNLTHSDSAVFGKKDFQQLAVIRQMVRDLNFPITIVGCPIIREADGLAMSSRNKYLLGEGRRKQALCLYNAIQAAREYVASRKEEIPAQRIIDQTKKIIEKAGAAIEYAVVKNVSTLRDDVVVSSESILVLAVKIGGTVRLIDNGMLFSDRGE